MGLWGSGALGIEDEDSSVLRNRLSTFPGEHEPWEKRSRPAFLGNRWGPGCAWGLKGFPSPAQGPGLSAQMASRSLATEAKARISLKLRGKRFPGGAAAAPLAGPWGASGLGVQPRAGSGAQGQACPEWLWLPPLGAAWPLYTLSSQPHGLRLKGAWEAGTQGAPPAPHPI